MSSLAFLGAFTASTALAATTSLWGAILPRMQSIKERPVVKLDQAIPRTMPYHNQGDPRWGSVGYAGGTLTSTGCGLCSASMALSYWTRDEVTPDELVSILGDSCTTGGLNDMRKFRDAFAQYGLVGSDAYYSIDQAIADARAGKTVWCSVRGQLGAWSYHGHIVLLWSPDGERLMLQDPGLKENTREWPEDELKAVPGWKYFYSVWKDGYV